MIAKAAPQFAHLLFPLAAMAGCLLSLIAAWVMGRKDLKDMDAGAMDSAGRGTTNAGRICGMIGTLLAGIALLIALSGALVWRFWQDDATMVPRQGPSLSSERPPAVEVVAPERTNVSIETPVARP